MQRGRETSTPVRSQAIGREPSGPRAAETRLDPDKARGPRGTEGVQHDTATRMRPRTPLERRGSSCSAGCTKNQPRRPILRPFCGPKQFRPDCLQVPSQRDLHWQFGILFFACFRLIFCQTLPKHPSRTTALVLQCRLHHKSAPQTNSKPISWRQTNPARLPSGTQLFVVLLLFFIFPRGTSSGVPTPSA